MPQSFASVHCHIVFSTKNRTPWIDAEMAKRLYEYMGGTLRKHDLHLTAAGGVPDHVHLLVSLGRQTALAEAMRIIKPNSSRWIHEEYPRLRDFAWQDGYGAFSVSYSRISDVERYIAGQAEHHRTRTFQEEFVALLDKHCIQYDPRYLWE